MGDQADQAREAEERHPDWEPEDVGRPTDPRPEPITGVVLRPGLAYVEDRDPWHRLGIWVKSMPQGHVAVNRDPERTAGEWSIMMEFGREAEDSPMAGGAAYGLGDTLNEALEQALKDLRA